MEAKINIVEILKDKPLGTKLYSSACGKCELKEAEDKSFKVSFYSSKFGFMNGEEGIFDKNGKLYDDGECIIFPSKEMRDWSKFAWKKGDVLVTEDGSTKAIFECFEDDTYLTFKGKYCLQKTNIDEIFIVDTKKNLTECFSLQAKNIAQIYIHNIEDRMGGILNMETLEIEKTQPEFKNGDIVALMVRKCTHIAIFQSRQEAYIGFHAVLCQNDELLLEEPFKEDFGDIELRPATDSEKQQLFEALAKENKAWDTEKKQIVDLPKKCEFKPFDKVLCRNSKDDTWEADFFARLTRKEIDYTQSDKYLCVGDLWMYCIPYNEETAHLLGTTDDWKGGEG